MSLSWLILLETSNGHSDAGGNPARFNWAPAYAGATIKVCHTGTPLWPFTVPLNQREPNTVKA